MTIGRLRLLVIGWFHSWGGDFIAMVVPFGITLSVVVLVTFFITGWLGGGLVFRHRVGKMGENL